VPDATHFTDRAASLRITSVQAYPLGMKGFVRIDTAAGLVGWGEINNVETRVACALAESLGEVVIGENPTRTEHLWQRMFRAHRNLRGGGLMLHTIAAIDMALWDIAGKAWDTPVYRLLGGPCRERIWMYPSSTAIKTGPGGPLPFSATPAEIEALVDRVRQTRQRVGPAGAVMFDAHSCLPPATVIQFTNALRSDELLFLEEPWVPGNIDAMRRIRASVRVPLATGERDRTVWEVREILEAQVIDILQPDCGHGGGITPMRKVASLAEAHFVPIAPHCTMSSLGLSASLHVAASTPMFLIHEGYADVLPETVVRKTWELDAEGYASLPQGPGLGVEVIESGLDGASLDPDRSFRWPDHRHRDGSVADY